MSDGRWEQPAQPLWLAELTGLVTGSTRPADESALPLRIEAHATLPSTNARLMELARAGAPAGTVVIAAEQTAGRCRLGRFWQSPPGGIWLSLLLHPCRAPEEIPALALTLGLAVAEAVAPYAGRCAVRLKWPNDLLACERKLAGLLLESTAAADGHLAVVVGLGLNAAVQPELLPPTAVSLTELRGADVPLATLAASVLREMRRFYLIFERTGFRTLRAGWMRRAAWLGSHVVLYDPYAEGGAAPVTAGLLGGVADDGALLLLHQDGTTESIRSGELSLRLEPRSPATH